MKNFSHLQSVHTENTNMNEHKKSILSKIAISCFWGVEIYLQYAISCISIFKGESSILLSIFMHAQLLRIFTFIKHKFEFGESEIYWFIKGLVHKSFCGK
jgi:hypothetical protein